MAAQDALIITWSGIPRERRRPATAFSCYSDGVVQTILRWFTLFSRWVGVRGEGPRPHPPYPRAASARVANYSGIPLIITISNETGMTGFSKTLKFDASESLTRIYAKILIASGNS
jgi:hypothetical protein